MPISQLIYVSTAAKSMTQEALEAIVEESRIRNRLCDVTGVLMCCGRNLMQLLEGEESKIRSLFDRIARDPRHQNVQLLLCKPVKHRLFPEWGMGLVDLQTNATLKRDRLQRLIEDIADGHNTSNLAVESRVLLQDFRQQLHEAA